MIAFICTEKVLDCGVGVELDPISFYPVIIVSSLYSAYFSPRVAFPILKRVVDLIGFGHNDAASHCFCMQKSVSARPEQFSAMVHTRRIPNSAPLFLGSEPIVRQDPNLHLKMPISSISLDRTYRKRRPCSGVAWRG